MVLGLDTRFLGRKREKINHGEGNSNRISYLAVWLVFDAGAEMVRVKRKAGLSS